MWHNQHKGSCFVTWQKGNHHVHKKYISKFKIAFGTFLTGFLNDFSLFVTDPNKDTFKYESFREKCRNNWKQNKENTRGHI